MTTENEMTFTLENGDTVKLSYNNLIDQWVVMLTTTPMKIRVAQYMGTNYEDAYATFVELTSNKKDTK